MDMQVIAKREYLSNSSVRHIHRGLVSLVLGCVFALSARAQTAPSPGTLDTNFAPVIGGFVGHVLIQPDGKMVIGGGFTNVNGAPANYLARLNVDGTLDTTFDARSGSNITQAPAALALQEDGKILVALGGPNLVRLNSDGSADSSFASALEFDALGTLLVQPDGEIFIRSAFTSWQRNSQGNLEDAYTFRRLNPDGSISSPESPIPTSGPDPFSPRQTDGKSIFLHMERDGLGDPVTGLTLQRLNPDGTQDPVFQRRLLPYSVDIAVTPNDQILVKGSTNLFRLNPDGVIDATFQPVSVAGSLSDVKVDHNGRIVIVGDFSSVNGVPRTDIARLYDADPAAAPVVTQQPQSATLGAGQSARFAVGVSSASPISYQWQFQNNDITGATNRVLALTNVTSGSAGNYTVQVRNDVGSVVSSAAELTVTALPSGTVDPVFNPAIGTSASVYAIRLQSDGKMLIGGNLVSTNSGESKGILRLLPDGTIDSSFTPSTSVSGGAGGYVAAIDVQSDGKVLIGGPFASVNGTERKGVARLASDGSLDETFRPTPSTNLFVKTVRTDANGKVLIGGDFSYTTNANAYRDVVRLNADGSLDASFDPEPDGKVCFSIFNCGDIGEVNAVDVLSSGKIIIAGTFNAVIGSGPSQGLVHLNPDGSADTNFASGLFRGNYFPAISSIAQQPDGKLVIAGIFTIPDGYPTPDRFVTRFKPDGTVDGSFYSSNTVDDPYSIKTLAIDAAGRILLGGTFNKVSGTPIPYLARLNPDGSLDTHFLNGSGPNGPVQTIVPMDDGSFLIGGFFTAVNGVPRNGIARLLGDSPDLPTQQREDAPDAGLDSRVSSMILASDRVYLSGSFDTLTQNIGGSVRQTPRRNLAALQAKTAWPAEWAPQVLPAQPVNLAAWDDMIFLFGSFTNVNGQPRSLITAVDAQSGALKSWNAELAGSYVDRVAVLDGKLVVMGSFITPGPNASTNLALLDAVTGNALPWNPNLNRSYISAMAAADGHVFFGGLDVDLTDVDLATGAVKTFTPFDKSVVSSTSAYSFTTRYLYAQGGRIYGFVEGTSNLNGNPGVIYGYDLNQSKTLWTAVGNGQGGSSVSALFQRSGVLYFTGNLALRDGDVTAVNIGALNANTGKLLPFVNLGLPSSDLGPANSIVATDDTVFVGGSHLSLYPDSRVKSLLILSTPNYSQVQAERTPDGKTYITVGANRNEGHTLQVSTNLSTWSSVMTQPGAFRYGPLNSAATQNFFRAVTP